MRGQDDAASPREDTDDTPSRPATQEVASVVGFQRELTNIVARGEGAPGIAAALWRRTGHDALIQDATGGLLAGTRVDCALLGPLPAAFMAGRPSWASPQPVRWDGHLVATASPDGDALGAVVLCDHDGTAEEFDLVALLQAAMALGLELFRLRSVANAEIAVWGDLAHELLDSSDTEKARRHARQLGHDADQPHRAVVVTVANGRAADLLSTIRNELGRLTGGNALATVRDADVVLLTASETKWTRLATAIAARSGVGVRIGIGGKYDVSLLRRSLADADLALSLTAAVGGDGPVAAFDDLGIWKVFAESIDSTDLRALVTARIGPLLEYDEQRGTEFVKTIATYLNKCCEIEATAAALFVHRNTLVYRLKRIAQIVGIDLADADQRFYMDLACRAWTTMKAVSGGASGG